MSDDKQLPVSGIAWADFFSPALEYMIDAAQRSVLFADVMRQRGNQYLEHPAEKVPHVLTMGPHVRAAPQLCAGAHQPAGWCGDRSAAPAICRDRPARRPWPGHRRLQVGQRNRSCAEGWASLLFCRLPARADAGSNHRRHCARGSDFPGEGHLAASWR